MRHLIALSIAAASIVGVSACELIVGTDDLRRPVDAPDSSSSDAGPEPDAGTHPDAGQQPDAGQDSDAGPQPDASTCPDNFCQLNGYTSGDHCDGTSLVGCQVKEGCAVVGSRVDCGPGRTCGGGKCECDPGHGQACNGFCCVTGSTCESSGCGCPTAAIDGCQLAAAAEGGTGGTCAAGLAGTCSYTCRLGGWEVSSNGCVDLEWVRWPVSGPAAQYTYDSANDSVTDSVTGLVWQYTSGAKVTLSTAKAGCASRTNGGKAWRLPTVIELLSIIDPARNSPAIDSSKFFVDLTNGSNFWTTTPAAIQPGYAWVVDFKNGGTLVVQDTASQYQFYRCVR